MNIILCTLVSITTYFFSLINHYDLQIKSLNNNTKEIAISPTDSTLYDFDIRPAAHLTGNYIAKLKNKKIALCVNQTSTIGNVHLVDTLRSLGINIAVIFAPEHGFRGKADAGEHVDNSVDATTGIKIISLYGDHKKPTSADLADVDMIVFDIQDVGCRFYTFISTLNYVMEACVDNSVPLLVLDRPNPNGFFIDGPILEKEYASFVGMNPVPIVHGMTIGEYALMINGEHWLGPNKQCNVVVVQCENYNHNKMYYVPIAPSPNLKSMQSIYLYPTLCLFEGTPVSVGRGTETPFEHFGHPDFAKYSYQFIPQSNAGAKNPTLKGTICYGVNAASAGVLRIRALRKIQLNYILNAYNSIDNKATFFTSFFDKLAGNASLQLMIKNGKRENEIRQNWEKGIADFKIMRKKYLLYTDF